MRKNSVKNTRINSEVLKTLAELFRDGIKDPRVPAFTSVTEVEVAPDLKTCKVYVSFLCDEDKISDALKGVQSAEGYLKRELARRVNLRNTPELRFYVDNSIAYGNHMSKLIEEANKNIRPDEE